MSGYKIAAGHLADGIDIVVKDLQKVIRTRSSYDSENPLVGWRLYRGAAGIAKIIERNKKISRHRPVSRQVGE